MRQVTHPRLNDTPRRQVGNKGHDMANLRGIVTHHLELQPLRVEFAVLAGFYQFTQPTVVLCQRGLNDRKMPPRITAAGQLIDPATHQLFHGIPADPAERLVDREHFVGGIKNHNAFAGGLEHRRRQPTLLDLAGKFSVELLTAKIGVLQFFEHAFEFFITYFATLINQIDSPDECTQQSQKKPES